MENRTSARALCVAAFFQMAGVGLIVALLPSRVIQLSYSIGSVGFLASAFAVPFVLFQLPVGILGDRYGHKRILVVGYLISCLTGLVYFRAGSVLSFLGGRVLQGLGEIPAWAIAPALLSLLLTNRKGEAIGTYNASIHLGLTAGSIMSVFACSVWTGNEAFLFYAVTGLIGALVVALYVKDAGRQTAGSTTETADCRQLRQALKGIDRPAIHAGIALYGGSYGAFLTVIPGVLLSEKGFSQSGVALFFALFYVAISLSQVIAGKIADRRGSHITMHVGLLLVASGLVPFMWADGNMIYALLGLASFGLGMFCVSAMVLLNEAVPISLKGAVSGTFFGLWGLGFFAVPPILTRLGGLIGYGMTFSIFAAVIMAELFALRMKVGE